MIEKTHTTNNVHLCGRIIGDFIHSHSIYGKSFYETEIEISRLSGNTDILPLTIPEKIMQIDKDYINKYIQIIGEFRSYNMPDDIPNRKKLKLTVFAKEIKTATIITCDVINEIRLDGFLCKKPVYRKTPLRREISDLILAVNRITGKSDYLPCICWGANARKMSEACVGDHVRLAGRIQSRIYEKNIDSNPDYKKAYEVSAKEIDVF